MIATLSLLGCLATSQEITLRRQHKVGEVYIYDVTSEIKIEGRVIAVRARSVETTTAQDEKSVTIEINQTDAKVLVEKQEIAQPDRKTTNTFNRVGRLMKIVGEAIDGDNYRRSGLLAFEAPNRPLKMGDDYTVRLRADSILGMVDAEKKYKVEASETVLGRATTKLRCTAKELGGKKPISMDQTLWIETSTGVMVKQTIQFQNLPMINNLAVPGRMEFILRS